LLEALQLQNRDFYNSYYLYVPLLLIQNLSLDYIKCFYFATINFL
jgi:hypothetical protein